MLCELQNSILAIIDVQPRLTAAMPAKVLARLQRNTTLLLRAATLLGVPVVATEQYPQGLGELEPDVARLLPGDAVRRAKTGFSCTSADGLVDAMDATGRRQVVLIGMEAHVCVLQSAFQLQHIGYQSFVVADAVCSRHRESYETALQRMQHGGIVVTDSESVLFEWTRDSRHPHFKELQGLIR
jgi:nicotinamidase-related amidase